MSRMNHSCGPNAWYIWDVKTWSISLYTTRHVAKDEALTYGYADIRAPRGSRREELSTIYRFDCHCSFCDVADVAASDARRAVLIILDDSWEEVATSWTSWAVDVSRAEDAVLKLLLCGVNSDEKEGLKTVYLFSFARVLGLAYVALGDKKQALFWGAKIMACPKSRLERFQPNKKE